MRIKLDKDNK